MPIDQSIPLQARMPAAIDPMELYGQAATVEALRDQATATRLAGEETRQKMADAAAIRRVMQESGGDWEKALPQLRLIAPSAAVKLEADLADARGKGLEALTKQITGKQTLLKFGIDVARLAT